MWDVARLGKLSRSLGEESWLSVYVGGSETDPSALGSWRRRADVAVRSERQRVEAEWPTQLEAFDQAWKQVEASFPSAASALGSLGWVAFASSQQVLHSTGLPSACETLVHWGPRIRLVPYIRALSQNPELILVLVDVRRARLFRVADARVSELHDFIADRVVSERAGDGMMKAAGTSSGRRGETRRDAGQRAAQVSTERMIRDVVAAIEARSAGASAIVLGGNDRIAAAVREALDENLASTAILNRTLQVTMSDSEIADALVDLAAEVRERRDEKVAQAWSEHDWGKGLSAAGWNQVVRGLDEGAIDSLLLSSRYLDDESDDAETLVARALEAGSDIQALAGVAGRTLDEQGQGVGARLRFASSFVAD